LQQTRVAQGTPYYKNFIEKYPRVEDLAAAKEQDILKLWQGLGYYSRARYLHQSAKEIVSKYRGVFPKDYKSLLQLKGVGQYTAAAIASFAYNEPVAVLDGNVFRVLSRYYGIKTAINTGEGKKIFQELAQKILDKTQPGKYNQAIMEFGALHCTPQLPKCNDCPFQHSCIAYQTGKTGVLPEKIKKNKIKKRYFHYFLVQFQNRIILRKRKRKDIWKNLYELPLIESYKKEKLEKKDIDNLIKHYQIEPESAPEFLIKSEHKLTHQHLQIYFWRIKSKTNPLFSVAINKLDQYPLPIAIAKFLDNNNL